MNKGKKREATPRSPKVSPASVDAPPATLKRGKSGNTYAPGLVLAEKADIPEELESVWDDEIAATFKAMADKEQIFLLAYVKCWEKAEAFRAVRPLASDTVAATQGGVMFRKIDKTGIWERFKQSRAEALFLVEKTYNAAAQEATKPIFGKDDLGQPILVMDQPDHAVRVKAAEAISKLHGLNQPAEVKHSGEITSKVVQINLPTRKSAP